ncbi:MAG: hypothetical protein AAFS07_19125, partial [Pseudomonadota bacterium]
TKPVEDEDWEEEIARNPQPPFYAPDKALERTPSPAMLTDDEDENMIFAVTPRQQSLPSTITSGEYEREQSRRSVFDRLDGPSEQEYRAEKSRKYVFDQESSSEMELAAPTDACASTEPRSVELEEPVVKRAFANNAVPLDAPAPGGRMVPAFDGEPKSEFDVDIYQSDVANVEQPASERRSSLREWENLSGPRPELIVVNPTVVSPILFNVCAFCGSALHAARDRDGVVCQKLKDEVKRVAAGLPREDHCAYPPCALKYGHYTPSCPTMHTMCPVCDHRGHVASRDCYNGTRNHEEDLRTFEAYADKGVWTRIRRGKPYASWGFFSLPEWTKPKDQIYALLVEEGYKAGKERVQASMRGRKRKASERVDRQIELQVEKGIVKKPRLRDPSRAPAEHRCKEIAKGIVSGNLVRDDDGKPVLKAVGNTAAKLQEPGHTVFKRLGQRAGHGAAEQPPATAAGAATRAGSEAAEAGEAAGGDASGARPHRLHAPRAARGPRQRRAAACDCRWCGHAGWQRGRRGRRGRQRRHLQEEEAEAQALAPSATRSRSRGRGERRGRDLGLSGGNSEGADKPV